MIIKLKNNDWLERQRIAGKCVRECLFRSKFMIENENNISLRNIETTCIEIINTYNCVPTFLNYQQPGHPPFPGAICASVNKELVHGIPRNYLIQEGDIVKIDLGATYQGAIADAAITTIKGKAKSSKHIDMVRACKEAMDGSIKQIRTGARLGTIGNFIYRKSRDAKMGLVVDYGGHFICENRPHAFPFVNNKSKLDEGIRIQSGMTFAIEPLLTVAENTATRVLPDGWTVVCHDVCAHFEHTVYVHENSVEIIT